jgi:hypothetical protein
MGHKHEELFKQLQWNTDIAELEALHQKHLGVRMITSFDAEETAPPMMLHTNSRIPDGMVCFGTIADLQNAWFNVREALGVLACLDNVLPPDPTETTTSQNDTTIVITAAIHLDYTDYTFSLCERMQKDQLSCNVPPGMSTTSYTDAIDAALPMPPEKP